MADLSPKIQVLAGCSHLIRSLMLYIILKPYSRGKAKYSFLVDKQINDRTGNQTCQWDNKSWVLVFLKSQKSLEVEDCSKSWNSRPHGQHSWISQGKEIMRSHVPWGSIGNEWLLAEGETCLWWFGHTWVTHAFIINPITLIETHTLKVRKKFHGGGAQL